MNLNDVFPLMLFINLESRKDRLEHCTQEFNKLGINPTRVEGVVYTGAESQHSNGIVGCTMSHIKCLKMAKEANCNTLIFEDDVMFINDYEIIISSACEELSAIDWDMFYLGANILKPFNQVTPHLAKLTWAQSAHAYGVRAGFADTLLQAVPENTVAFADLIYATKIVPEHNCFITAPDMVAVQKNSYSDIELNIANYESYLEPRYYMNYRSMENADEG